MCCIETFGRERKGNREEERIVCEWMVESAILDMQCNSGLSVANLKKVKREKCTEAARM